MIKLEVATVDLDALLDVDQYKQPNRILIYGKLFYFLKFKFLKYSI